MSTELNLTTLNWTVLTCDECGTVSEVLATDLEAEYSIRCRGCGSDLSDSSRGTDEEIEDDQAPSDDLKPELDHNELEEDLEHDSTLDGPRLEDAPAIPMSVQTPNLLLPATASPSLEEETSDDYESDYEESEYEYDDEPESNDASPLHQSDEYEDEIDVEELVFTERPQPKKKRAAKQPKSGELAQRWARLKETIEQRRDDFAGVIVSVVVHGIILLLLTLIVVQFGNDPGNEVIVSFTDAAELGVEPAFDETRVNEIEIDAQTERVNESDSTAAAVLARASTTSDESTDFALPSREEFSRKAAGKANWSVGSGTGFEGRVGARRARLAAANGGTPESEAAVELGLAWLANHQLKDGSWSFSGSTRIERCTCEHHGRFDAKTGATGMALLAFLGAGYTHQDGKHQKVIKRGLDRLVAQSDVGDFRFARSNVRMQNTKFNNASMYSHGLASIALCEAYGMTKDRMLMGPARNSLNFIATSQHTGGGWRYSPNSKGDTSVVGWQVMAIVSGRMSGLHVSREVPGRVVAFLDSVHIPGRGTYGYKDEYDVTPATMAIGTLCRMYLHYGFEHGEMVRSVKRVAATNPSRNNAYANYYAMQVLHHWGGHRRELNAAGSEAESKLSEEEAVDRLAREKVWSDWNARCRDRLVKTQIKSGHSQGAWKPFGDFSLHGGMLYQTALTVMTLEVYYRHLPIYDY